MSKLKITLGQPKFRKAAWGVVSTVEKTPSNPFTGGRGTRYRTVNRDASFAYQPSGKIGLDARSANRLQEQLARLKHRIEAGEMKVRPADLERLKKLRKRLGLDNKRVG